MVFPLTHLPDDLRCHVMSHVIHMRPDYVAVAARTCHMMHAAVADHLAFRRQMAEDFLLGKMSLARGELVGCNSPHAALSLRGLTNQEYLLCLSSFVRKHTLPNVRMIEIEPHHSIAALAFAVEVGYLPSLGRIQLEPNVNADAHADAHESELGRLLTACSAREIHIYPPHAHQDERECHHG